MRTGGERRYKTYKLGRFTTSLFLDLPFIHILVPLVLFLPPTLLPPPRLFFFLLALFPFQ